MMSVDRLVEETLREEPAGDSSFEMDPTELDTLGHAMGQHLREMASEMKNYLLYQAKASLRQLRENPKGLAGRIVSHAGLLIRRCGFSPARCESVRAVQNLRLEFRRDLRPI
jgi:hypothetical protein